MWIIHLSNLSSYRTTSLFQSKTRYLYKIYSFHTRSRTQKILISSKVHANATDVPMGRKKNYIKPGKTGNTVVHNDQHGTALKQIQFSSGNPNYPSTLSRTFKTWTSNSKSSTGVILNKGHPRNNIVTMTSFPL